LLGVGKAEWLRDETNDVTVGQRAVATLRRAVIMAVSAVLASVNPALRPWAALWALSASARRRRARRKEYDGE
jgi:hypothetical protein